MGINPVNFNSGSKFDYNKANVSAHSFSTNFNNNYDIYSNNEDYEEIDYNIGSFANIDSSNLMPELKYTKKKDEYDELIAKKENLEKKINELNEKLEQYEFGNYLEEKAKTYYTSPSSDYAKKIKDQEIREYNELKEQITSYKEEFQILKQTIKQLKKEQDLYPYAEIMQLDNYNKFKESYSNNYQNLNYEEILKHFKSTNGLENFTFKDTNGNIVDSENVDFLAVVEFLTANNVNFNEYSSLSQSYDRYLYLTDEQKIMYHYLFKTEGYKKAEEYANLFDDDINQQKALSNVEKWIKEVSKSYILDENGNITSADIDTTLQSVVSTFGKGSSQGMKDYIGGIAEWIGNDNYSVSEYEQMYLLNYLQNNKFLQGTYQTGQQTGQVLSQINVSLATTMALGGGGSVASLILGTASDGGSKYHYALVNGSSNKNALSYAYKSMESSLATQMLSNIPFVGIPVGNVSKVAAVLLAGASASAEVEKDAKLRESILNETVNWDEIDDTKKKVFLSSVLIAGLSEGGMSTFKIIQNNETITFSKKDFYKLLIDEDGLNNTIKKISESPKKFKENINHVGDKIENTKEKIANKVSDVKEKVVNKNVQTEEKFLKGIQNKIKNNETLNNVEEAAIGDYFKKSSLFSSPAHGTNENLTPKQKIDVKSINKIIKKGQVAIVNYKDTLSLSSSMLSQIDDLSNVKFVVTDGLDDGTGSLKVKYSSPKYLDRITYSGFEMQDILKNIEDMQAKIDMNLPPVSRAYQAYSILSEVPVMWDFNQLNNQGKMVSQSLRGLSDNNLLGKKGLVCAGYASAYKELCNRIGVDCEYIRGIAIADPIKGGALGGHAWNVVKVEQDLIPVDVTWHATGFKENKDWFGPSKLFQDYHKADVDEPIKIYDISKVASIYDLIKVNDDKFGYGEGYKRFKLAITTGDYNKITRSYGARAYLINISNDVKNIVDTMNIKYQSKAGADIGIKSLKHYIDTGDASVITSTNNARTILSKYTREELKHYLQYLGCYDDSFNSNTTILNPINNYVEPNVANSYTSYSSFKDAYSAFGRLDFDVQFDLAVSGKSVNEFLNDNSIDINKRQKLKNFCETTDSGAILSKLSSEELKSCRAYSGESYQYINQYLRNSNIQLSEYMKNIIYNIDSAMTKSSPIKSDMLLYRGVDFEKVFKNSIKNNDINSLVGQTLQDSAYMSTSVAKDAIREYNTTITIKTPKGTKALNMFAINGNMETEFLLDKNTKLHIDSVKEVIKNGQKNYDIIATIVK